MSNFVQDFIYFILSFQEKLLRKKLKRSFKSSYSNSTSKKVYSRSATLDLTVQTEKNKEKAKQGVNSIVKKYAGNPEKLLEFVENSGTRVYKIPFAEKLLKLIGYQEGLITGLTNLKALYLYVCLLIFNNNLTFSAIKEPIFVVGKLPLDSCYMIQHFHKWYSMRLALPGFDSESQENFQKFLSSCDDNKISELSIEEILGLKEAIARDVEAINFVVEFVKSTDCSKNALKKITAGGASV